MNANAHYFEDGNINFKEEKKVNEELSLSRDSDSVEKDIGLIMKAVLKLENTMQIALEEFYEQVPDNFFKALRRSLPITNQKMEWNTNALKVIQNLKGQK